jgi:TRAP-type C4-dicarboxylate transport system substrate-binding protein
MIALSISASAQTTKPVQIRLGTVAPKDSPWYDVMNRMGQEWKRASNGKVVVQIFPGGTLGAETDMLRKVKLGQIEGVGMSGVGLSKVAPGFGALQLPMLVDSFEDLDRVRNGMEPRLRAALDTAGFKALNFSDVGWVRFFTASTVRTPEDLKKMKLFINADDRASEQLYQDLKFHPVPLGLTDLVTSLQTRLIDAFDVPPLLALSDQSFALAKHMIDLKWGPVVGATFIDRKAWERIPADLRPELERIAQVSGAELQAKIRASDEDAIRTMKGYGLIVESLTPAEIKEWQAIGKTAREELKKRGMIPAADFDEAVLFSVDPVSGSWTGDWGSGAGPRNRMRLDLKWNGAAVTGTLRSTDPQRADAQLRKSSFDPRTGALHLEVELPGARGETATRHIAEGKLVNGAVTGAWTSGATKADFKLSKSAGVTAR